MLKDLKKVELEITSDCNAACPGCARTQHIDTLKVNSFSLQDLQRLFPVDDYSGVEFKFCGVLGDPIVNPDCLEMTRYLVSCGGFVHFSTNGGYNTAEWWEELGRISAENPDNIFIHFCIDGHKETNHIYRVNTKWNIVKRNIEAYAKVAAKKTGAWIYIVFDHNEHELEIAKQHAASLGFEFATRTGMRNSYHDWIVKLGKKNKQEEKTITTTGKKQHSKVNVVKELDDFIEEYKSTKVEEEKITSVTNSIVCKYIHEGEIFIANDLTLWPCCFLWDNTLENKDKILEKLSTQGDGWNSLKDKSIDEVLEHPWYKKLLVESWHPYNDLHLPRCIKTCAKNKAYHNEILWQKD
jgi:MoaA/NifB/PqqE/SkfB family radical SAM enzyme